MDDCRKRQTSTATPAEPGDLPWGLISCLQQESPNCDVVNIEQPCPVEAPKLSANLRREKHGVASSSTLTVPT